MRQLLQNKIFSYDGMMETEKNTQRIWLTVRMIRFKFLSFGRKLDEMEFEFESSSTNFVKLREQADEQKQTNKGRGKI